MVGPPPPGAHAIGPPVGPRGGTLQRDNWFVHSQILRERGEQPDEPWLVNLYESLQFAYRLKGQCPCLTRKSQPWILSHGRCLTARECARLQGVDGQTKVSVSDAQFRAMLGNSMSVDVLMAILSALMPVLRPE